MSIMDWLIGRRSGDMCPYPAADGYCGHLRVPGHKACAFHLEALRKADKTSRTHLAPKRSRPAPK